MCYLENSVLALYCFLDFLVECFLDFELDVFVKTGVLTTVVNSSLLFIVTKRFIPS